jgi:hypothetical protein
MKKIGQYLYKGIILTNLFTMVLLMIVIYWSVFPRKIIKFNTPEFRVITKQVKAGGFMQYESDVCKYVDKSATVIRTFVNGVIFNTVPFLSNRKVGCVKDVIVVPIPPELSPGMYYLKTDFIYNLNPVRTATFQQLTEQFEIIK